MTGASVTGAKVTGAFVSAGDGVIGGGVGVTEAPRTLGDWLGSFAGAVGGFGIEVTGAPVTGASVVGALFVDGGGVGEEFGAGVAVVTVLPPPPVDLLSFDETPLSLPKTTPKVMATTAITNSKIAPMKRVRRLRPIVPVVDEVEKV